MVILLVVVGLVAVLLPVPFIGLLSILVNVVSRSAISSASVIDVEP